MNDRPTVMPMEPRTRFKATMAQFLRNAPDIAEGMKHIARIRRASYLAHLAERLS